MNQTAIEVCDLQMSFGDTIALSIPRLVVPASSSTVLVGHNGAGKSTFLMILAGLIRPTSGSVVIAGGTPGSMTARRAVSFVPDQPALFDDLTLEDQLHYVARLYKKREPSAECLELLAVLDAEDLLSKFPRSMSKGQRQKSSLLVATARPFSVLLLDEPTTGLDAASRMALVTALQRFAGTGTTVISSTHEPELITVAETELRLSGGLLEI